jgi:hypothetical protein
MIVQQECSSPNEMWRIFHHTRHVRAKCPKTNMLVMARLEHLNEPWLEAIAAMDVE